jgi:enolase
VSIGDELAEDDWAHRPDAARRLAGAQLLGDDLFCTDVARVHRGIEQAVANAVLVEPNQAGTLSAADDVVALACGSGIATVLSARSGETEGCRRSRPGWVKTRRSQARPCSLRLERA